MFLVILQKIFMVEDIYENSCLYKAGAGLQ